jgi:uncharacterized membrane protein
VRRVRGGARPLTRPFALPWDAAGVAILHSNGSRQCEPSALSSHGRVIAGNCYVQLTAKGFVTRAYEAVRRVDEVLHVLEPLPGEAMSFASDVFADGEVIVGSSTSPARRTPRVREPIPSHL